MKMFGPRDKPSMVKDNSPVIEATAYDLKQTDSKEQIDYLRELLKDENISSETKKRIDKVIGDMVEAYSRPLIYIRNVETRGGCVAHCPDYV